MTRSAPNQRGIEAVEIHAGRNRLDPVRGRRQTLARALRHVIGHRDQPVRARQPALDHLFDHALCVGRAMKRGDPFGVEPACHRLGKPGRGRRARQHDVDIGVPQAGRQASRQGETGPQGIAERRQFEVGAAQAQKVGHHGAAR
jgi:hypothetical protein